MKIFNISPHYFYSYLANVQIKEEEEISPGDDKDRPKIEQPGKKEDRLLDDCKKIDEFFEKFAQSDAHKYLEGIGTSLEPLVSQFIFPEWCDNSKILGYDEGILLKFGRFLLEDFSKICGNALEKKLWEAIAKHIAEAAEWAEKKAEIREECEKNWENFSEKQEELANEMKKRVEKLEAGESCVIPFEWVDPQIGHSFYMIYRRDAHDPSYMEIFAINALSNQILVNGGYIGRFQDKAHPATYYRMPRNVLFCRKNDNDPADCAYFSVFLSCNSGTPEKKSSDNRNFSAAFMNLYSPYQDILPANIACHFVPTQRINNCAIYSFQILLFVLIQQTLADGNPELVLQIHSDCLFFFDLCLAKSLLLQAGKNADLDVQTAGVLRETVKFLAYKSLKVDSCDASNPNGLINSLLEKIVPGVMKEFQVTLQKPKRVENLESCFDLAPSRKSLGISEFIMPKLGQEKHWKQDILVEIDELEVFNPCGKKELLFDLFRKDLSLTVDKLVGYIKMITGVKNLNEFWSSRLEEKFTQGRLLDRLPLPHEGVIWEDFQEKMDGAKLDDFFRLYLTLLPVDESLPADTRYALRVLKILVLAFEFLKKSEPELGFILNEFRLDETFFYNTLLRDNFLLCDTDLYSDWRRLLTYFEQEKKLGKKPIFFKKDKMPFSQRDNIQDVDEFRFWKNYIAAYEVDQKEKFYRLLSEVEKNSIRSKKFLYNDLIQEDKVALLLFLEYQPAVEILPGCLKNFLEIYLNQAQLLISCRKDRIYSDKASIPKGSRYWLADDRQSIESCYQAIDSYSDVQYLSQRGEILPENAVLINAFINQTCLSPLAIFESSRENYAAEIMEDLFQNPNKYINHGSSNSMEEKLFQEREKAVAAVLFKVIADKDEQKETFYHCPIFNANKRILLQKTKKLMEALPFYFSSSQLDEKGLLFYFQTIFFLRRALLNSLSSDGISSPGEDIFPEPDCYCKIENLLTEVINQVENKKFLLEAKLCLFFEKLQDLQAAGKKEEIPAALTSFYKSRFEIELNGKSTSLVYDLTIDIYCRFFSSIVEKEKFYKCIKEAYGAVVRQDYNLLGTKSLSEFILFNVDYQINILTGQIFAREKSYQEKNCQYSELGSVFGHLFGSFLKNYSSEIRQLERTIGCLDPTEIDFNYLRDGSISFSTNKTTLYIVFCNQNQDLGSMQFEEASSSQGIVNEMIKSYRKGEQLQENFHMSFLQKAATADRKDVWFDVQLAYQCSDYSATYPDLTPCYIQQEDGVCIRALLDGNGQVAFLQDKTTKAFKKVDTNPSLFLEINPFCREKDCLKNFGYSYFLFRNDRIEGNVREQVIFPFILSPSTRPLTFFCDGETWRWQENPQWQIANRSPDESFGAGTIPLTQQDSEDFLFLVPECPISVPQNSFKDRISFFRNSNAFLQKETYFFVYYSPSKGFWANDLPSQLMIIYRELSLNRLENARALIEKIPHYSDVGPRAKRLLIWLQKLDDMQSPAAKALQLKLDFRLLAKEQICNSAYYQLVGKLFDDYLGTIPLIPLSMRLNCEEVDFFLNLFNELMPRQRIVKSLQSRDRDQSKLRIEFLPQNIGMDINKKAEIDRSAFQLNMEDIKILKNLEKTSFFGWNLKSARLFSLSKSSSQQKGFSIFELVESMIQKNKPLSFLEIYDFIRDAENSRRATYFLTVLAEMNGQNWSEGRYRFWLSAFKFAYWFPAQAPRLNPKKSKESIEGLIQAIDRQQQSKYPERSPIPAVISSQRIVSLEREERDLIETILEKLQKKYDNSEVNPLSFLNEKLENEKKEIDKLLKEIGANIDSVNSYTEGLKKVAKSSKEVINYINDFSKDDIDWKKTTTFSWSEKLANIEERILELVQGNDFLEDAGFYELVKNSTLLTRFTFQDVLKFYCQYIADEDGQLAYDALHRQNPFLSRGTMRLIFNWTEVYVELANWESQKKRIDSKIKAVVGENFSQNSFYEKNFFQLDQELASVPKKIAANRTEKFIRLGEFLLGRIRLYDSQIEATEKAFDWISGGKKGVFQLPMGLGKSHVLLPLWAFYAAKMGKKVVRIIVDQSQIQTLEPVLRESFGNLGLSLYRVQRETAADWKNLKKLKKFYSLVKRAESTQGEVFILTSMEQRRLYAAYYQLLRTDPDGKMVALLRKILDTNFFDFVDEVHLAYDPKISFATSVNSCEKRLPKSAIKTIREVINFLWTNEEIMSQLDIQNNNQIRCFDRKKWDSEMAPRIKKEFPNADADFLEILLTTYLPSALQKKIHVQYGMSDNGQRCVPYRALNEPSYGYFRNPYEEAVLDAIYLLSVGISRRRWSDFCTLFSDKMSQEVAVKWVNLENTEAYRRFQKLTELTPDDMRIGLTKMVDDEKILKKINGDRKNPGDSKRRLLIWEELAKTWQFSDEIVEVNSSELALQSKAAIVMSGTVTNRAAFPSEMASNFYIDKASSGKILKKFLDSIESNSSMVLFSDNIDDDFPWTTIFNDYWNKLESLKKSHNWRVFLDFGAFLQSNIAQFADKLANFLREKMAKDLDALIFFDDCRKSFAFIDLRGKDNPIFHLSSLSLSEFSYYRLIDPHRFFLILDQQHCTGTNFPNLLPTARGLLTLEPRLADKNALEQASLRLRDYLFGQEIDLLLPQKGWTTMTGSETFDRTKLETLLEKNTEKNEKAMTFFGTKTLFNAHFHGFLKDLAEEKPMTSNERRQIGNCFTQRECFGRKKCEDNGSEGLKEFEEKINMLENEKILSSTSGRQIRKNLKVMQSHLEEILATGAVERGTEPDIRSVERERTEVRTTEQARTKMLERGTLQTLENEKAKIVGKNLYIERELNQKEVETAIQNGTLADYLECKPLADCWKDLDFLKKLLGENKQVLVAKAVKTPLEDYEPSFFSPLVRKAFRFLCYFSSRKKKKEVLIITQLQGDFFQQFLGRKKQQNIYLYDESFTILEEGETAQIKQGDGKKIELCHRLQIDIFNGNYYDLLRKQKDFQSELKINSDGWEKIFVALEKKTGKEIIRGQKFESGKVS